MKKLLTGLALLFTFSVAQAQLNLTDLADEITSIIQNDTLISTSVFVYEYETEGGSIKHPDSLIADINYELFENITEKYPNQVINYIEPWVCEFVRLPSGEIVEKHLVTYTYEGVEYLLCFFVLDIGNDWVEINYNVRFERFWW